MPKPKTRDPERLRFTVSTARTVRLPSAADAPPLLPWPVAALGGGLVAGLAGALLVAGVVLVAWLSAIAIALPTVLAFSARVWLLAHGGVLVVGDESITIVPLGLTIALTAMCAWVAGIAHGQGRQALTGELEVGQRRRLLVGTIAQVVAGYAAFAAVLGWTVQGLDGLWRPVLGAVGVSLVGASLGTGFAAGLRPQQLRPDWLRRGLRGAAAGALALLVVPAVVLAVALVLGEPRIATLEDGLGFDSGGLFVWSLIALAYLPNLLAWALAWTLGAGFAVGTGSLVSLWTTELGMLPAIPVLGALPAVGLANPWMQAWLAGGVIAGGLAGVVAVPRSRTGPLEALTAAAIAGLGTAAVYLISVTVSRGGLGSLRMVGLGPRLLEALLIGAPLLWLSAVLAGLVTWFVRRRSAAS